MPATASATLPTNRIGGIVLTDLEQEAPPLGATTLHIRLRQNQPAQPRSPQSDPGTRLPPGFSGTPQRLPPGVSGTPSGFSRKAIIDLVMAQANVFPMPWYLAHPPWVAPNSAQPDDGPSPTEVAAILRGMNRTGSDGDSGYWISTRGWSVRFVA